MLMKSSQFLGGTQSYQPSRMRGCSGVPVGRPDADDRTPHQPAPTDSSETANRPDEDEDPDAQLPDAMPIDEEEKERRRRKKVADQREKDKQSANEGSSVGSPGNEYPGSLGPSAPGAAPHDGVQPQDKLAAFVQGLARGLRRPPAALFGAVGAHPPKDRKLSAAECDRIRHGNSKAAERFSRGIEAMLPRNETC